MNLGPQVTFRGTCIYTFRMAGLLREKGFNAFTWADKLVQMIDQTHATMALCMALSLFFFCSC